jgi:thiamine monophosphate kinase
MKRDPIDLVLKDSDDYELIITCLPEHVDGIRSAITGLNDIPVTEIGRITEMASDIKLKSADGVYHNLTASGWDHFSTLG